jgi:hypothetical protein
MVQNLGMSYIAKPHKNAEKLSSPGHGDNKHLQ